MGEWVMSERVYIASSAIVGEWAMSEEDEKGEWVSG